MPLFQARHYEWFANFAALNLDHATRIKLILALESDNPKFNPAKFGRAVLSHMNDAREAALERASLLPIDPLARTP